MPTATKDERSDTKRPDPPQPAPAEAPRRLVVELNRRSAQDLAWLVDEEELNKTTIVNRALQVYKLVIETQQKGGSIYLDDPDSGIRERMRVV